MSERTAKIRELLLQYSGQYIAQQAHRDALITPTQAVVSRDLRQATIFVSVFPEEFETSALGFLKRHRSKFRAFLRKNTRLPVLPFISFELDGGEKNRQRIDEIVRSTK